MHMLAWQQRQHLEGEEQNEASLRVPWCHPKVPGLFQQPLKPSPTAGSTMSFCSLFPPFLLRAEPDRTQFKFILGVFCGWMSLPEGRDRGCLLPEWLAQGQPPSFISLKIREL